MSTSIFSAAMSADFDGLFGTLDAELEQAVSLFSKEHCGASAPLFFFSKSCAEASGSESVN